MKRSTAAFPALTRLAFGFAVLAALPSQAPAATASLVRDVAPGPGLYDDRGAGLGSLVAAGDKVFFVGGEIATGAEPWVSDGTWSGTRMLADICPGRCSSEPRMLGSAGGVALWTAGPETGRDFQLWRSDGTRPGTYPLLDDVIGSANSFSSISETFFRGALYLGGCREGECGLWRTDGTVEGTVRLADAFPSDLAAGASRLFFMAAANGTQGLWVTDGTPAGTRLVRSLGDLLRSPGKLTAADDRAFFGGTTTDGQEVWASDGTAAGTRPVTQLPQGQYAEPFGPFFLELRFTVSGRHVYFVADDVVHGYELWRSDGTPQGTRRVSDFGYNVAVGASKAAEVGGRILFVADDGLTATRLWTTDGDPESTAPLGCTGECPTQISSDLIPVGGRVLFLSQGPFRNEVWISDGTPAGTRQLVDPCNGCQFLQSTILHVTPREVIFAASGPNGYLALWKTDGTAAGTQRLTTDLNLHPQQIASAWNGRKVYVVAPSPYGSGLWEGASPATTRLIAAPWPRAASANPLDLVEDRGKLVFSACHPQMLQRGIWQSAGTFETTVEIAPPASSFQSCNDPLLLTPAAGLLFFKASRGVVTGDLWRTDGTPAGTVRLTEGGPEGGLYGGLAELGGRIYFAGPDGDGVALWKSDGSLPGTVQAVKFPAGTLALSHLTRLGAELYFTTAADETFRVWRSDGTTAGTRQLLTVEERFFPNGDPDFTRAGTRTFFLLGQSHTGSGGRIWKTDGTAADTTAVSDALGGEGGTNPSDLTAFQNAVYYFAETQGDRQLWRTDGTAAGTTPLRTFAPADTHDFYSPHLTAAAGRLFFAADDGVHGVELWTSDGTAAGTVLVRDILPGPEGSRPAWLRAVGNRVYFAAGDGVHGWELWVSDGTAAGTRLVQDIAPLAASSYPERLTVAGDRLYFTAHDGVSGRELWSLPLTAPAACVPSNTVLCVGGGRFQVEARWRDFTGNTGLGQASAITADTGTFWFFAPSNVEVIVKLLDGRGINDHRWVFYGALSSVEYTLIVTDTATGLTRHYFNPAGQLASFADTEAFGPLGASEKRGTAGPVTAPPSPAARVSTRTDPAAAKAGCQAAATRLCLSGGRFAVEATWKDFQGNTGTGQAVALTGDTGYFWFFGPDNVEVVLKVLDGTALNGKHWIFYGALSSVEYRLTVTDTATGTVKVYENPSGRLGSVADTSAF